MFSCGFLLPPGLLIEGFGERQAMRYPGSLPAYRLLLPVVCEQLYQDVKHETIAFRALVRSMEACGTGLESDRPGKGRWPVKRRLNTTGS